MANKIVKFKKNYRKDEYQSLFLLYSVLGFCLVVIVFLVKVWLEIN